VLQIKKRVFAAVASAATVAGSIREW